MNNYSGVQPRRRAETAPARPPFRKDMSFQQILRGKSMDTALRRIPMAFLALCLCASSLHFLGIHADRCLPATVEESAGDDHGHEDPGEDHFLPVKKHSSNGFLSGRTLAHRPINSLPSLALPPLLPPPKN